MSKTIDKQLHIQAEQIRLLHQHAPRTVPFHGVVAAIVVFALWAHVPSHWLIVWWLALAILSVYRLWSAHIDRQAAEANENTSRLGRKLCVGVALTGAIWAAGFVAFSTFVTVEYQMLIVIVLAGLCSAGVIASYGVKQHFYSFVLPVLGVAAWYSLLQGSSISVWSGVLVIVYLLALLLSFARYSSAVVELIGMRLENAQLVDTLSQSNQELLEVNEQLLELSSTDGLTQIANRRHFDQVLQREWGRAQRAGSHLAYIMVDIDFFKPYNDHYGHLCGDDCIKAVAQALQGVLRRPGDFVGRYGGEEFAVISPDTPTKGAAILGEKIRACIEALAIPHAGSPAASYVTVSVGVAGIVPRNSANVKDLIQSADKALYEAKRRGRNQVVLGEFQTVQH